MVGRPSEKFGGNREMWGEGARLKARMISRVAILPYQI